MSNEDEVVVVNNLINKTTMKDAQVREIEFVEMFVDGINKLVQALGVTRKVPVQAGTVLKTYKASGTLENGKVAEGETIPLSKYKVSPKTYKEITLNKWRKATSAEAIVKYGYDQAVTMTTDKMIKDAQKEVRKGFFTNLATGTGTATGTGLQAALAQVWGELQVLFEDTTIESVYFVNPKDIADYLASAQITTQTAFGMQYIENFLGLGTVFIDSSVTKGTVYGTAKENVVMYYIAVNGADLGEAFNFTSDELGLIGIHESADYTNMTTSDTVVDGIEFFAERIDGIVVGTIGAAAATEAAAA